MVIGRWCMRRAVVVVLSSVLAAGCTTLGPYALDQTRLYYNEVIKRTTEEQLLLNIVRLRYTDTPSSLAVSAIAAQFERSHSLQLTPFFVAGNDASFTAVLPQALVLGADRPTLSLTPLPLDGVIYLAKTTWPIATVFRLYLENLNWVPNAQTASGPTPKQAPVVAAFLHGMAVLQLLQDRAEIVFGVEAREERLGGPVPAAAVSARDVVEAAKNGYEYRPDDQGTTWTLIKKNQQAVLRIAPEAVNSPEVQEFVGVFRLRPGRTQYDITQEALNPFPSTYPPEGVTSLDLETRSLLQALYYVSHGIDIPPAHATGGLVTVTRDAAGQVFDWGQVMRGLFRVRWAQGSKRPPSAHVAVQYKDYWFYIEDTDQETKATFSLLMELARLELAGKTGPGPQLTLPVGGK